MLLIDKLREQNSFTDAERVLANYILENLSDISKLTIYELSDKSFCSVATISRFCKKLRVKNFSALKVELAKECSNNEAILQNVQNNYPFNKGDNEQVISEKIRSLCIQSLKDTHKFLDFDAIHKAAVLIDNANIVDIYANWNSFVSGLNLHSKLLWIGKNSNIESIRGFQLVKAKVSNEKHLAILISYYGTNERNLQIAKRLRYTNTPYILITGPKINPLCLYAEQVIHLPAVEDFRDKIYSFSSDLAMEYTINILYSFLFALHYDKNINSRYSTVFFDDKIELK